MTREGSGRKGDPYLYSIARQCSFPGSANTAERESNSTADPAETEDQMLVPNTNPGISISREQEFSQNGADGSESIGQSSVMMAEEEL